MVHASVARPSRRIWERTLKILVRRITNATIGTERPGYLWPVLRWASVHVVHYECARLDQIAQEFRRWAFSADFDRSCLGPFDQLLANLETTLTNTSLGCRIRGFEFGTDGYNLMLLVRLGYQSSEDRQSGRTDRFFRELVNSQSSPQSSLLVGETPDELLVGLSHARLPLRSIAQQSVWVLAEMGDGMILSNSEILKEVG